MIAWLEGGRFPARCEEFLRLTDNEVTAAIGDAAEDPKAKGHEWARRISARGHYRLLYHRNPRDDAVNPKACRAVAEALAHRFGQTNVLLDESRRRRARINFPVREKEGHVVFALEKSQVLSQLPLTDFQYVFVAPEIREDADRWLKANVQEIIGSGGGGGHG